MSTLQFRDRTPQRLASPGSMLLRTGDRLDAETFIQLYERMPEGFRAELIGGIVYVALPMTTDHGGSSSDVSFWLGSYRLRTPGVRAFAGATIRLGSAESPEPDASLVILPECGGQASLTGGYIVGAPELVVEVAYSTRATDLNDKLKAYEKAGVREYVVVLPQDLAVQWFVNRDNQFIPHLPGDDGLFRSTMFPGLWLDGEALIRDDVGRLVAVIERGTNTPEHAAFVKELAALKLD